MSFVCEGGLQLGGKNMQINLGEKIKELRKRDGRKQEDLAKALGVTAQAVSRWEANGGYPDMNMIPAIANYFHVTIDALFGYHDDREIRIKEIVKKANQILLEDKDIAGGIRMLREALGEFPAEPELQMYLAHMLCAKGGQQSERPNPYLEEAAILYEEVSRHNGSMIRQLLYVYVELGEFEKAEKKAMEQPSLELCREVLLASVFQGINGQKYFESGKAKKYYGEEILSLLHELQGALEIAIARNEKLANTKEGIDILLTIRKLYEGILGENCGKFHSDLCMLNMSLTRMAIAAGEMDQAISFYQSAFAHYQAWESLRKEQPDGIEEHYDTPLLSEVGDNHIPIVFLRPEYLQNTLNQFPLELRTTWDKRDGSF